MRLLPVIFVFALVLSACTGRSRNEGLAQTRLQMQGETSTRYATGFETKKLGSCILLSVYDPWQQSRNVIYSYVLAPQKELVPDSLSHLPFISIPVTRVIALSTTHLAMIDHLEEASTVVGVSGKRFIYSPLISERIRVGSAQDVGYGQGLDFEAIVGLRPDLLFLYGVEGNVVSTLEKLTELGIPAVFCGEYLEPHPLGKAEWIKFFSIFYGQEKAADSLFHQVDSAYTALVEQVSDRTNRPGVLTGLPWKDSWYMAGGKSFAAQLIGDAGGDYLWSDNPSTQAVPLDLESVYLRAVDADIWINPGAATSLEEIARLDQRFRALPVLQNAAVFNNNARMGSGGGNDYWESGTVRPDLVLKDLIAVFHPDLMPYHQFVYYRQLK